MEKIHRDCTKCVAYQNMTDDGCCALGFHPEKVVEMGYSEQKVVVRPFEDECEGVGYLETRKEEG